MLSRNSLFVLVVTKTSKLRVPEMIAIRLFEVFNPRHKLRSDPHPFLHVLREAGSPPLQRRAEFYFQQLDALRGLRREVRRDLLAGLETALPDPLVSLRYFELYTLKALGCVY